jgi:MFS family permease
MCAQALLLVGLVLSGLAETWQLFIFAAVNGLLNAFDMPLRETLPVELVVAKDFPSAVAANWVLYNVARVLGAALAGLFVAAGGLAYPLAGAAACQALAALLLYRIPNIILAAARSPPPPVAQTLVGGLSVALRDPLTFWLLALLAGVSLFSLNFQVLLPLVVRDELLLGAAHYGWLMTSLGLGSAGGAVITFAAAHRASWRGAILAGGCLGGAEALLAVVRTLVSVHLVVVACGFFAASMTTIIAILLQANAANVFRTRVMALYLSVFFGTVPLGAVFAGVVADRWGAPTGFLIGALLAVGVSATVGVVLSRRTRPKAV